jgi:hypothetical protein
MSSGQTRVEIPRVLFGCWGISMIHTSASSLRVEFSALFAGVTSIQRQHARPA